MSDKNFMSYGDAETVFSEYANAIKALDPEGGTLDTRLSAVEDVIPSGASESNKLVTARGTIRGLETANWITTSFDNAVPSDGHSMQIFTVLNSATNTPATGANYIVITQCFSTDFIQQEAIQNGTNNRYIRYYDGSSWSSWQKLVTESEADLLTIPISKFQIGSGGAIGYADLGTTTTTISQAFSWLEVEYGRVDGFIDKYFISVAGASSNLNYIKVVRLTDYGQTPTITLDANKHLWMSMDTYVYIRVKAYGNFSISGTLSRTAPTGTTIPINRLVTESDLTSSVTSGSTAPVTSGGVYSALAPLRYAEVSTESQMRELYTGVGGMKLVRLSAAITVGDVTIPTGTEGIFFAGTADRHFIGQYYDSAIYSWFLNSNGTNTIRKFSTSN